MLQDNFEDQSTSLGHVGRFVGEFDQEEGVQQHKAVFERLRASEE